MNGLMRVSAVAAGDLVELVVPSAVPLAEVVPDLADSVRLLDPERAPSGYRVESGLGRVLALDASLADQGVRDGDVVVVRPGVAEEPASPYDDVLSPFRPRRSWPWRLRDAGWPGAARRTSSGRGGPAP